VVELRALLTGDYDLPIAATPGLGAKVELWMLGSSLFGAQLAAKLGLPYAFAAHFAPDHLDAALAVYRRDFAPSEALEKPHVMVAMNVFAAAAMMMPTPELALSLLTVAGFFLLAPGIAAVSCVAEIAPNRLRAKVSALFTLLAGLITNTAGPFLVGFITDRVFGDPNAINLSLAAVMLICGSMGALMILGALPRYRRVAGARVA